MADQFASQYPMPSRKEVSGTIQQRMSGPNPKLQQEQDLVSWRYNQPQGFGASTLGTAYPKSRRQMRMQEEEMKFQQEQLQQQRLMQEMDLRQKEYEMQQRDQFLQENDFYYNRGLKEAEQKLQAEERSQATSIIGSLNQLDPKDPDYRKKVGDIFASNPLGAIDPNVQRVADQYGVVNDLYLESEKTKATGIKEAQDKYAEDMQKLIASGVAEEDLPQYIDPKSPVGLPMFNPLKVAARLGTTEAKEKAETKSAKEETPKQKIGLDLQQAYGELNSALMGGEDTATAQSKVAGLRARYEAATGEAAPEVFPQPKTQQEYDRLPAGTSYIGKDGKRKIKQ